MLHADWLATTVILVENILSTLCFLTVVYNIAFLLTRKSRQKC